MNTPKFGMGRIVAWAGVGTAVLAAALLGACGGGGSGGSSLPSASLTSVGTIDALGSITVNGVKFETTGAQVIMDGVTVADDSQLRTGMVVEVEGEVHADGVNGTANKVTFDDTIQGVVGTTNLVDRSITVMGKTVSTDDLTKIDDSVGGVKTFDDLAAGTEVQISGALDDNGNLRATHIQLRTTPDGVSEATGVISGSGTSFTMAGLPNVTINTAGATITPAGATLTAGDLVEVKGSFTAPTLTATTVEIKSVTENETNFRFEGFVISGDVNSFVLQGHHLAQDLTVTTSGTTVFVGGNKADVVVGTKLEAQGNLVNGTLQASKVKFKENIRIEMTAGPQDAAVAGIELLNLSAVKVVTNNLTSPNAAVASGDSIRIRGRMSADGTQVVATRIDNQGPAGSNPERVILRGPVSAIGSGNSSLTILGVSVPVANVQFRPNDDNGSDTLTMNSQQFFSQVKVGTVVKVKGSLSGNNTLVPTEIELED